MAHKIAIIEDDLPIRVMYEMRFQKAGFIVKTASNGQEGLELVEHYMPDLVVLDLKMPIMNGEEMLERMRQTDWGAGIRVVILTNTSKDEAPMSLRVLRVDRYVVKAHYTPTQVVDIVQEILGDK